MMTVQSTRTFRPYQKAYGTPGSYSTLAQHPVSALQAATIGLLLVNVGRLHEPLSAALGAIPIAKLLLLLALLALFSSSPWALLRKAANTRLAAGVFALASAILISVPFSYYRRGSVEDSFAFFFVVLPIVVFTVASIRNICDLERFGRVLSSMVAAIGGLLAAGVGSLGSVRVSLVGAYDPNDLALVVVTCLPFCLWAMKTPRFLWKTIGLLSTVLGVYVVVKTGSRGGFIALALQLSLAAFVVPTASPKWLRVAAIPVFSLSIALAPMSYRERLLTLTSISNDYNTTDITGRSEIWKRGLGYFIDRPFTGVGVGQFAVAEGKWGKEHGYSAGWAWMAPHNAYVEAAAELGILGITSLLAILFTAAHNAWAKAVEKRPIGVQGTKEAAIGAALFLSIISFAVGSSFVTAALSPVFMMLISFSVAFESITRHTKRQGQSSGYLLQ
jgi:putative inorganic carbon (HCO3(-)) transporter